MVDNRSIIDMVRGVPNLEKKQKELELLKMEKEKAKLEKELKGIKDG